MKKLLTLLSVLFLSTILLVGCGTDEDSQAVESNESNKSTEQVEEEANEADETSSFPITVTDAMDVEVGLEQEPERIVSLIPSNTEIAYALGLGEKIVGVSDHDNYPEEALEKEKVGGMELNVEVIIGLEPDLVLAHATGASTFEEALEQIRDTGIPVFYVENAEDIETTYATIQQIGQVTGTAEKADEIINQMKEEFATLEEITAEIQEDEKRSVFFEVSPAPDMYTAGKDTFFNEILQLINAENAAGDIEGWAQIDPESIVEMNPDVIITTYGYYTENAVEQVLTRDGWDSITAIEQEDVYDVHTDLLSRPGPRLVEGAKELAEIIYPQLFEE